MTDRAVPSGDGQPHGGAKPMKRALLASLLTASLLGPTGTAQAVERGPCADIPWRDGTKEVAQLIRCVWRRFDPGYGGPVKALQVAKCESGLNPAADGGSCEGLFQHQERYWPGRYESYIASHPSRDAWGLSPSIWNGRTQAIVTALMVRQNGWGDWACA